MSQQGARQASVRAVTGTTLDYNGDWSALFDLYAIPQGDWNGRMLAWINAALAKSYTNLPDAMQAFAQDQGAYNWSSLGTFVTNPSFVFNLTPTMPPNASLTRASANGTRLNASGDLEIMATDTPRFTYGWTGSAWALRGLLNEPPRTNLNAYNNPSGGTGFVAGTPGTNPGNLSVQWTGPTRTMVDQSTEKGLPYVGFSFSGLPSTNGFNIWPLNNPITGVSVGQIYVASGFTKRQSGDYTNILANTWRLRETDNAGLQLAVSQITISPTTEDITKQWFQVSHTIVNAGSTRVNGYTSEQWSSSGSVGVGFRLGGQQMELVGSGDTASSTIITTGATATRAADVLTLSNIPTGTYNIAIVRESGTTNLNGVPVSGSYVVPTSVSPLKSVNFTRV